MKFLEKDIAKSVERRLLDQIEGRPRPKAVIYHSHRPGRDCRDAADAVVASLGNFEEATLLYLFCVTGDGYGAYVSAAERWHPYKRWRAAQGEARRLYDAPGHEFEAHEAEDFAQVVCSALDLGWEAMLSASPGRQLAFLSHDERLEIYRGFEWRWLTKKLLKLGYWHN